MQISMRAAAILTALLVGAVGASAAMAQAPSDDQVRQKIIEESIASYPGRCPCPYNLASNGSRCGGRSAYSRAGGYSPLCYPQDVSDEMVRRWRDRH